MNEHYFDKIANLLLYAVHFTAGDKLTIVFDIDYRDLALLMAKKAYAGGAAYVEFVYNDQYLHAAAIGGTAEEFWFPDYLTEKDRETVGPGWKTINVLNEAEADAFENLPAERASSYFQAYQKKREIRIRSVSSNAFPWTLTFLPSKRLARLSFPDLPAEEGLGKYWDAVIRIMHLDEDDPREFWQERMAADEKRSDFLTGLDMDSLHFSGPGTDLTVGICETVRWIAGYDSTPLGERFIVNIPTEEIFTSPDFRRTEGLVRLTRPFIMHRNIGPIPMGAWFEFRDGKVVDFGADRGKSTLKAFFDIDERGRYLGEIALVDPHSPTAATGMTYYNGLHDENTACHMAFGFSYSYTLKEPGNRSDEELLSLGLNRASVHEDAMIGGPEVDVTARLRDGGSRDLIRDGRYLI